MFNNSCIQTIICFCLLSSSTIAQSTEGSKLINALANAETPSDSLNYALEICEYFSGASSSRKDSSLQYAEMAIQLSETLNNEEKLLESKLEYASIFALSDTSIYFKTTNDVRDVYLKKKLYFKAAEREMDMAKAYNYHFNPTQMRAHCENSLKYLKLETRKDQEYYELEALCLYYISNSYNFGENYQKALEYALEMEKLCEEQQLKSRLLMCYETIADIYNSLKENNLAEKDYTEEVARYLHLAYSLALETEKPEMIYGAGFNLGRQYYHNENYTEAKNYFNESLEMALQEGDLIFQFNNYIFLGFIGIKEDNTPLAQSFSERAQKIYRDTKIGFQKKAISTLNGEIYFKQKKYTKAKTNASEALRIAIESSDLETQLRSYRQIEKIATAMKDWPTVIENDKQADKIQDSIYSLSTLNNIQNLKNKHKLEQKEKAISQLTKEKEIEELKSQNRLYLISSIGLLLLGGFLWFYLQNRNKQIIQQKNSLELEKKVLRLQMNPHFIFNTISSIQNYLYDKADLSIALNYMSKFADLMRQTLENSREEYISLHSEIDSLRNYLGLQKLRYNDKFNFEITVDESLNPNDLMVPPLIAQPFVENAIEHGRIYSVENGNVNVVFKKENNTISLIIEDNGVANRKLDISPKVEKKSKKSLATIITRERLAYISKERKQKFELSSKSIPNKGTTVNIKLPIIYMT